MDTDQNYRISVQFDFTAPTTFSIFSKLTRFDRRGKIVKVQKRQKLGIVGPFAQNQVQVPSSRQRFGEEVQLILHFSPQLHIFHSKFFQQKQIQTCKACQLHEFCLIQIHVKPQRCEAGEVIMRLKQDQMAQTGPRVDT